MMVVICTISPSLIEASLGRTPAPCLLEYNHHIVHSGLVLTRRMLERTTSTRVLCKPVLSLTVKSTSKKLLLYMRINFSCRFAGSHFTLNMTRLLSCQDIVLQHPTNRTATSEHLPTWLGTTYHIFLGILLEPSAENSASHLSGRNWLRYKLCKSTLTTWAWCNNYCMGCSSSRESYLVSPTRHVAGVVDYVKYTRLARNS